MENKKLTELGDQPKKYADPYSTESQKLFRKIQDRLLKNKQEYRLIREACDNDLIKDEYFVGLDYDQCIEKIRIMLDDLR